MRKAEFDRAEVLRKAMSVFQQKGFSKTTMQDLVAVTGLHPGSLYCAFSNKRGILIAVAQQYAEDRALELEQHFHQVSSLQGIKTYLESVVDECASCSGDSGCLIAKSMNELAEQDEEIQAFLAAILTRAEQRFTTAFTTAIEHKELNANFDGEARAKFFMMGIYGLRTYAHTHPTKAVLDQLAAQLFQAISH